MDLNKILNLNEISIEKIIESKFYNEILNNSQISCLNEYFTKTLGFCFDLKNLEGIQLMEWVEFS